MTRTLKPCGTTAAYRRHLRKGEKPCGACRDANAAAKRAHVIEARQEVAEVVRLSIAEASAPEVLDELDRLRWNLKIVESTMAAGVPSGLAALSKQHADLVKAIVRLESAASPEVSKLDELAARRAARLAGS